MLEALYDFKSWSTGFIDESGPYAMTGHCATAAAKKIDPTYSGPQEFRMVKNAMGEVVYQVISCAEKCL